MDELKGFSPAMREHFKNLGKTDAEIAELEGSLANKGQAARSAGLESKEVAPEAPLADPTPEPVTPPDYATRDEVAAAVADSLKPIMAALAEMQASVKALTESDESKIAKAAAATPRASLQELIANNIIGSPAAVVDGRTALAKAGPKQAAAEPTGYTASPLLNSMMQRAQGGAQ